ncbi:carbohydrate-binding domain-containing protein [Rothia dentocariosa]|uniref:carbohydrate-binding domain-containing protein n=1 Tax=Rothia dentocariosa TaxID=2047 RepID=UPI001C58C81F|nr:carbohydrate-binding domain-containing protein [Rothia dentocariosa]QXT29975.1 carbohydrate-binding domain-containing protein [Rothia dentocariosa]
MNKKILTSATSVTLLAALALTGCSTTSNALASGTTAVDSSVGTTATTSSATATDTAASSSSFSTSVKSGEKLDVDTHYSEQDLSWDTSSETAIDLSNPTATDGVTVEDGTLTITKAGTYKLSGEYQGQIKVETANSDAVRLVLDNANITNSSGAALNVVNADEVILYSASGTTNTIGDGADYTATGEDDPDAVVYSKADLTIAGEGTLKVNGNHEDGIHTSDGLVIASGTLEVNAANTGIKGKDYVDILGGTINVTAQQDGIKSTNDTDEGQGWTRLSNGTVTVNAGDDGFKASRVVEISGGSLTVEQSDEGIEAQYINVSGGDVNVTSADDGMNASLKTSDSESTDSSANTSDTADQQQNNQQQGSLPGGQQNGTSNQQQQGTGQPQPPAMSGTSQDGTSQNGTTGTGQQQNNTQNQGNQNMGQPPAMPGGNAQDGTTGTGQQGMGQPPQGGMPGGGGGTFQVVDAAINVSGGNITVNAEGDGIDSNGVTTLSGGTLIVNGPSQGGNAALDTNGDLLLNGATVLSGSTADMFEAPSTNSTSGYLKLTNSSGFEQGSTVQVADSSGKVVANYKVTKSNVQLVLVSSSSIVKGQSYTVYTTTSAVDSNATSLASGATELGSFTAS